MNLLQIPAQVMNISRDRIVRGDHSLWGDNTILIQIADPAMGFPRPAKSFLRTYQFRFLDSEPMDNGGEFSMTLEQGEEIANILREASEEGVNIVVHCNAGICRSGAISAVAQYLGYQIAEDSNKGIPNLWVKNGIMKYFEDPADYESIFASILQ